MEQNKKFTTGVWILPDADVLEDFFLQKAAREQKLGRVLTENEVHELLREFKDKGEIDGIEMDGDRKKDVKAILSEHFNVKKLGENKDNV